MDPTLTTDTMQAAWDRLAPHFDAFVTPHSMRVGEQMLSRVPIQAGVRLLDVACGSGALAIPAARAGAEVTAIDIAPRMIELLTARAESEQVQVDGRVMDACQLELGDDAFDVTTTQNGITMAPSPLLARALEEMVRVTRPGGTVLVAAFGPMREAEFLTTFFAGLQATVPGFEAPSMSAPPPPFQLADLEVFVRVMSEAGLHDVSVERVTWEMPVSSGAELWNEATSSNPIAAQLVASLDEAQHNEVLDALDTALQQRFGGRQGGTLTAAVNLGRGTV